MTNSQRPRRTEQRTRFIAFTDGACHPNPGAGGWGFVLIDNVTESRVYKYGGNWETTNNRMELMAVAQAIETIKIEESITIITDSKLIVNTFTKWVLAWKRRGWRKADGATVMNLDLVQRIHEHQLCREICFQWIKGHAGHSGNEQADRLAAMGRTRLIRDGATEGVILENYESFREQVKRSLEVRFA